MPVYAPAQARVEIEKLVETFRANESALHQAPEAQIENDFIRPLFRFLNWNVDNAGLARAEWEFVLQRTERGKRPDYELFLDGRRVLIMDAKKVKYEMHDPRWLNQVYAYAYSTQNDAPSRKVDFAILTDFQEFIVLDCTLLAGAPQAVHNFRVLDWRYPDYVARFDELWELFERDNVCQASRRRDAGLWARYLAPKKVKANRIPPDKAFLAALDDVKTGWRVRLAKDMKKHNPALGGDVLTAAVQLWIDRLIFIKVLSDREIEDDYLSLLKERVETDGLSENNFGWFTATRGIFNKLNQIYNGSVFAPRPELEAVNVSNKVVREIIGELLPENSPYNFDSLPVEILGTIYERFLGRVVHATEKQVRIEDKPEVRKAGGVFYTPQYIVNYMVANTVGKLLAECKTPADVARLKICDPACGSGSFLLGAYDALIEWHRKYYETKDEGRKTKEGAAPSSFVVRRSNDRDAYYLDDDGRVRLTAKLKRQILVNNIFGVDIDPQAVEVTRLSLSLKALEDTRREELYQEVDLFHQRVLPDLTNNIKCGNSLIGTDFIFTDADELKRVKPFDWRAEFPQVFLPPSLFRRGVGGEVGGFDAVIGNPPYIRVRVFKEIHPEQANYLESHYECAIHVWDIYLLMFEKAIELAREDGMLGFIIPIQTLHQPNNESLREILLEQTAITSIADLSELTVFEGAIIKNCIITVQKGHKAGNSIELYAPKTANALSDPPNNRWLQDSLANSPGHSFKLDLMSPKQIICEKLEAKSWRLDEICYVTFGLRSSAKGVGQGGKERLITKDPKARHAKPYLEGRDIKRYAIFPTGSYIRYLPEEMYSPRKPALFDSKKIVSQSMLSRKRIIATLDADGYYAEQSLVCIVPHGILTDKAPTAQLPLEFVLGIINSRVESFYFATKIIDYSLGGGLIHATPGSQSKLLVPRATEFQINAVVVAVNKMLELQKQRAAAQTETDRQLFQRQIDATDRQIDALVYELYGLTEEEIRIVENG